MYPVVRTLHMYPVVRKTLECTIYASHDLLKCVIFWNHGVLESCATLFLLILILVMKTHVDKFVLEMHFTRWFNSYSDFKDLWYNYRSDLTYTQHTHNVHKKAILMFREMVVLVQYEAATFVPLNSWTVLDSWELFTESSFSNWIFSNTCTTWLCISKN